MKRVIGAVAIGMVALGSVGACGTTSGGSETAAPATPASTPSESPTHHTVGKYEQTWHRPYSRTTCRAWLNQMNVHERFVSVADMLTGARDKGDGGTGVAPDHLIHRFEAEMYDICPVAPHRPITDVAVGIYLTHRGKYAPK